MNQNLIDLSEITSHENDSKAPENELLPLLPHCYICANNDFASSARTAYIKELSNEAEKDEKKCHCEPFPQHPYCAKHWAHLTKVCPKCHGEVKTSPEQKIEDEKNTKDCNSFVFIIILGCLVMYVIVFMAGLAIGSI